MPRQAAGILWRLSWHGSCAGMALHAEPTQDDTPHLQVPTGQAKSDTYHWGCSMIERSLRRSGADPAMQVRPGGRTSGYMARVWLAREPQERAVWRSGLWGAGGGQPLRLLGRCRGPGRTGSPAAPCPCFAVRPVAAQGGAPGCRLNIVMLLSAAAPAPVQHPTPSATRCCTSRMQKTVWIGLAFSHTALRCECPAFYMLAWWHSLLSKTQVRP